MIFGSDKIQALVKKIRILKYYVMFTTVSVTASQYLKSTNFSDKFGVISTNVIFFIFYNEMC